MRNDIQITKYPQAQGKAARFWAVIVAGELLAVVVYKKGALAIADKLRQAAADGLTAKAVSHA
jgi:hypothetical protein